jgi:ribosomal protein S18 acetylase RimI-like enzyme
VFIVNYFYRLINYIKRHGVRATVDRAEIAFQRLYSAGRMVIYYYDFPVDGQPSSWNGLAPGVTVERKDSQQEIPQADLERILNFWSPQLASRNLSERFAAGATLWIARCDGKIAGYGWTLTGHTMRSYFIPFGPDDVHLFDFLVFPEHRGRRVNPSLVGFILDSLKKERRSRAYIEVAEWNQAELKSLKRTTFHLFGKARKTSLFGRTIVEWKSEHGQNHDGKTGQKIS